MNSDTFAQALLNDNIKRLTKDYHDNDKKSTPKRIFEIAQFFTIESLLQKYFQEDSKKSPNILFKLFLGEAIAYLDNRKYSSLRK